jgi:membrane protease YdiL (CAAX protease family)
MTAQITRIHIPFTKVDIQITAHHKKILAVAIATFALLALQMGMALSIAFAATCVTTTLTYFSRNREDWFNTDFDWKEMTFLSGFLLLRPLIIQIVCSVFGFPFPAIAQEGLVELIYAKPWKMIPIATIVAPVAEEILFRGLLMEKLEDAARWVSRHAVKLGSETEKTISEIAQAIIFGAIHLRSKIQKGMHVPILIVTSAFGYLAALYKRKDRSLLSPIAIHSANNASTLLFLFSRKVAV